MCVSFDCLGNACQHAKMVMEGENHGVEARIDAWNVHVEPDESSTASVYARKKGTSEFVNSGWIVISFSPSLNSFWWIKSQIQWPSLMSPKKRQIYLNMFPTFGEATSRSLDIIVATIEGTWTPLRTFGVPNMLSCMEGLYIFFTLIYGTFTYTLLKFSAWNLLDFSKYHGR